VGHSPPVIPAHGGAQGIAGMIRLGQIWIWKFLVVNKLTPWKARITRKEKYTSRTEAPKALQGDKDRFGQITEFGKFWSMN